MAHEPSFSLVPDDKLESGFQAEGRVCPKCSYVRQSADTAPAWQCPRCEVAYDKALSSSTAQRAQRRETPIHPSQRKPERSVPWGWVTLACVVLALGLAGWKWRQGHPNASELSARAQNQTRSQEVAAAQAQLATETELTTAYDNARRGEQPAQALATIERFAADGNTRAMLRLALLYGRGEGVGKDHPKSMQWFRKAANEGAGLAFMHLGHIYETGRGEPQSDEQAANWYLKAARQGNHAGLYALGLMHAKGVPGAPKNPVLAHMLLDLADRAYSKDTAQDPLRLESKSGAWANGQLRGVAKNMSQVELVKAKDLADAWQPGQPFLN
jgi:uncharacterized protein